MVKTKNIRGRGRVLVSPDAPLACVGDSLARECSKRRVDMNEKEELKSAGTAGIAGAQTGMTAGGTIGAAAGGITGWGTGLSMGLIGGLVAGIFLGLAIAKSKG